MKDRLFATIAAACLIASVEAEAGPSPWVEVKGGAVRLISTGELEDGRYRAGLEFLLDAGWHTYWRYPGEAGIAPQITLAGSQNLASADVSFPAPTRYDDGFSTSIVYMEGVVFPITVIPEAPGDPVTLTARVEFGVCKDVCVPGEAELSLTLSPGETKDRLAARLIDRDQDRVPKVQTADPPRVSGIEILNQGDKPVLAFTADLKEPASENIDLFVEGPEGSYVGVPKLAHRTGKSAMWTLPLHGLKALPGQTPVRVVIIEDSTAVEATHFLESATLRQ
ncbi:hypothetical protein GCM10011316_25390 [Roseibium aquae]|uniref:Thiol:disulfide interchange protein DsbD N-terminal domain-containing protein n=1 Tax=Roseibium aquae TaxID=1323746 RepID=A0A916TKM7_9HYPH|nr:protein-disulfide reductase DsbD domain-containing protein [Roseibium aquae]GGB52288.1 hypothetical protein GCM10011316_25390 [Roseibium aquae]